MNEIFKDILDYEGLYQVSNLGRVKSLKRYKNAKNNTVSNVKERIRKNQINHKGYNTIILFKDGKGKEFFVHRLVAKIFINNNTDLQVNHIDCNKQNNNVNNLEWMTNLENQEHAVLNNLKATGEKHGRSKLKEKDVLFIRENKNKYSKIEFAKMFNITRRQILTIVNNKQWLYKLTN